jgi:hypothetical protein
MKHQGINGHEFLSKVESLVGQTEQSLHPYLLPDWLLHKVTEGNYY